MTYHASVLVPIMYLFIIYIYIKCLSIDQSALSATAPNERPFAVCGRSSFGPVLLDHGVCRTGSEVPPVLARGSHLTVGCGVVEGRVSSTFDNQNSATVRS